MKTNIAVAVAALAALSLSAVVPAQAQAPAAAARAHRGGGGGMQKMADKLGLSDAQKAQLKSIAQNAREQVKALHASGAMSSVDTPAKIKAIRKDTRDKMLAVLTPAQREQLKQMRHNRNGQ